LSATGVDVSVDVDVDVSVDVGVLVDVLVLVLVLAKTDVDQQPLPPTQANPCSIEFAAIATDRSKTIPRSHAESPIARGSATKCAAVGGHEHEHEHVNEHEYVYAYAYAYAYAYVYVRRRRRQRPTTPTCGSVDLSRSLRRAPRDARPLGLSR
jgi:hypothetical protein